MLNTKIVRALREDKRKEDGSKFTQADMAEALDMSISSYGRIERGEVVPSIEVVEKLAQLLDSSVEQLCASSPIFTQNNYDNAQAEQSQVKQNNVSHHHYYYGNDALHLQMRQLQQEKEQMQARYETLEALIEQLKSENTHLKELMDSMNKDNGD